MIRQQLILLAVLFVVAAVSSARASGWDCWLHAAQRYNVPVDLLYAIARVESGNRYNVVSKPNLNGTRDIGLMQINSSHLPRLRRYGITERHLLHDPCLNLHVGAMILAENIARYGYTWEAIGAYNAASDHKRRAYARKVYAMYDRIQRERVRQRVRMVESAHEEERG